MQEDRMSRRHTGVVVAALLAVTAGATVGVTSAAATAGTSAARAAACGTIPTVKPPDPNGVLKKLPTDLQGLYNGASTPVLKSAWANWKPKKKGPYTIGVSWGAITNPFQTYSYNEVQKLLKKSKMVKSVVAYAIPAPTDVATQLQQFNSLVQQKVDLIVLQPQSAASLQPAVDAAGKAGIPVIGAVSAINSKYAFSVSPNEYNDASTLSSALVKQLGGSGTLLEVHGIAAVQVDIDAFTAFKAVLANCPDVKVAGEIVGNFAAPLAKAATLQFLSTHPENIDGVLQTASMAPAIIQAFQQQGRKVPTVIDIQAQRGSLGYWLANKTTYKGVAAPSGPQAFSNLAVRIALRILNGQGPKLNVIYFKNPLVSTAAQLATVAQSSWDINTPGTAETPKADWLTDTDLNSLFNHPELKVSTVGS
jgi:ribose transport system substrate-binding protein